MLIATSLTSYFDFQELFTSKPWQIETNEYMYATMISQKSAIISKILHSNAKMSFVTFETISLDNKKAIKNKLKGRKV